VNIALLRYYLQQNLASFGLLCFAR